MLELPSFGAGRLKLVMPSNESLKNTAHFSKCRQYRYALWRTWDIELPKVMFIGLNPSTADETINDPTLIRCIGYAKSWGYGGVIMANLFAYRATEPHDMKKALDPIGTRNAYWLKRLAKESALVVAAWGNHGQFLQRSTAVKKLICDLHYLKLNKGGEPAHPLYQRLDIKPKNFKSTLLCE
ncbi:MAG: DUF1643 domain-containing protein [Enterobacterales bacterium]|nr:DUF1643 domain-containing protein [Enterobacterales bacterium]